MNELQQSMTTNGFFNFQWVDDSLKWNISDFGGQENLCISSDSVWIPDLTVIDTVTERKMFEEKTTLACIHNTGLVSWGHGDLYKTQCDFDILYFPFDTQVCSILLSTWQTPSDKARFTPLVNKSFTNRSTDGNPLWIIKDFSGEVLRAEYPMFRVTFTLKRRPAYYVFNLIIPIMLLSLLSSLVFALPLEYGDKVALSMTVLLSFTVFLTQMTDNMPRTSLQTSYLTIYLTILLTLSSLSVALSILILRVHRKTGKVPVIVQRCVTLLICCSPQKPNMKVDTSDTMERPGDNDREEKPVVSVAWKDVSDVLDALCLRLFMFLNVGCGITLFILLI
ncbi:neuronal acetylcholine receptor subunit alpha-5-like [Haliotis rufescens]|uniref:neuronal acetylcholine receptor subunit alpha-5-like n=1 Tax=Haliotis rufescens TaxID=6454 RepID=UPI00201F14D2|nr:neuronal acetylcholine receptor subunit alpha-5-like [Haliotis rufescens]